MKNHLKIIGEQNALLFPKITEEQSKAFICSFFPKYFCVWYLSGVFYLLIILGFLLKVSLVALFRFQDVILSGASSSGRGEMCSSIAAFCGYSYWFNSQRNVSSLFLSEFWKVFFLFNLSELDEGGKTGEAERLQWKVN